MSTQPSTHTAALGNGASTAGVGMAGLVDPGWAERRDEAAAVMSVTVLLGVTSGLLINWLGWPVGELLALGVYLACARLAWAHRVGGSS